MSVADEKVNIEHLLVEAMHNNIALPEDPLPSAEEIAGAKAAVAAAHSTYSAAAVPSQPVKGLGGAGLGLKRKGAGKAGNSSTISAATAPPALLGGPAGGKAATGAPRAAGAASNLGSRAAPRPSAAPTAAGGSAAAAAVAAGGFDAASDEPSATGLVTPEGPRQLSKDSSGVRSFRTTVSPDTADGDSSDWESASVDEGGDAGPSAAGKAEGSSTGWVSSMLDEFVDPSTLAVCGVVLGACAGALLVLGASIYIKSRQ